MRTAIRVLCAFLLLSAAGENGVLQQGRAQSLWAEQQADHARIVFDWTGPVDYAADIVDGRLVVRFDREIMGDLHPILARLPSYLRGGKISRDRHSVTFPLTGQYRLRTERRANSVIIDLQQETETTPAAAAPASGPAVSKAPSQGRASPPSVADRTGPDGIMMRVGRHKGFSRLVFDWPTLVPYTVDQTGSTVRATFGRSTVINTRAARSLPASIVFGGVSTSDNDTVVHLSIPPDAHVRHLRVGTRIVLDVMSPAQGRSARRAAGTDRPAPAVVSPSPSSAAPSKMVPDPSVTVPESAGGPAGEGPLAALRPPDRPAAELTGRSLQDMPPPLAAVPVVPDARRKGQAAIPLSGSGQGTASPPSEEESGDRMVFEGKRPSGLAMFQRAGWLWFVFDHKPAFDLDELRRMMAGLVSEIETVETDSPVDSLALRMRIDPMYAPLSVQEGTNWSVRVQKAPLHPETAIGIRSETDITVPRLILGTGRDSKIISMVDPEVGDSLRVVTVPRGGHGIPVTYSLTDVTLLPTAQGAVIVPLTDGVVVTAGADGVDITLSQIGLRLSSPELRGDTLLSFPVSDGSLLDIPLWYGNAPFEARHRQLRSVLETLRLEASSPFREGLNEARYALIRHFLAHGRTAEALAGLVQIAGADSSQVETPGFRALRGASNYLMGRYEEAVEDLSHPGLKDDVSIRMWLALARAGSDPSSVPAGAIDEGSVRILAAYPKALRLRLGQRGVDIAVDARNEDTAQALMDMLTDDETLTDEEKARLAYSQGRLLEMKATTNSGYGDRAIDSYRLAENSESRLYRALAGRARIDLQLRSNQISLEDAIEGYERLRFGWRGGEFEFSLLRRLGEMQMDAGRYPDGLRTLRGVVLAFDTHPEIGAVTGIMRDTFMKLYLDGKADTMRPLTAIALYYEFQELLPSGEQGDALIQRLADRLVAVDLLDQAAEILQFQVENRLSGSEKGLVGARLALVHTLNGKPEQVLDALNASDVDGLSLELLGQRRRLRAGALAEIGQNEQALALLKGDETRDADVLRSEICWKLEDWAGLAASLKIMVEADVRGQDDIDDRTAGMITDWASALILANDEAALARLRRSFGERMARTAARDTFLLLTAEKEQGVPDYRTVPAKIREVEDFRNTYRKEVQAKGVSATIN